jgi:hypothetical protein
MAKISKRVCDRCGKEVTGHERRISRLYKPIRLKWIVYGEVIEREYELCKKCTNELTLFLNNSKPDVIYEEYKKDY